MDASGKNVNLGGKNLGKQPKMLLFSLVPFANTMKCRVQLYFFVQEFHDDKHLLIGLGMNLQVPPFPAGSPLLPAGGKE